MKGKVQFRLQDATHPTAEELLRELFGNTVLEGDFVTHTDDGREAFLVVRVAGVEQPVLLPARKARLCPAGAATWPEPPADAAGTADEALVVFP
jgi:hypothetical protein